MYGNAIIYALTNPATFYEVAELLNPIINKNGIVDCNDALTGFYSFAVAPKNAPSNYGGILVSIYSFPMVMQLYMSDADGLFSRYKWYSNAWTNWEH